MTQFNVICETFVHDEQSKKEFKRYAKNVHDVDATYTYETQIGTWELCGHIDDVKRCMIDYYDDIEQMQFLHEDIDFTGFV